MGFKGILSRSGGEKGLRGSGAGTLGVPLGGTRPKRTGESPKPHPHDSTLGESSRDAQSGRRCLSGLKVLIKQLTGADQLAASIPRSLPVGDGGAGWAWDRLGSGSTVPRCVGSSLGPTRQRRRRALGLPRIALCTLGRSLSPRQKARETRVSRRPPRKTSSLGEVSWPLL